jgi:GTP cyclohydrolase I
MQKEILTTEQVWRMAKGIVEDNVCFPPDMIIGISRGGIYPAMLVQRMLSERTSQKFDFRIVDPFTSGWMDEFVGKRILLVDDIWDTGATMRYFIDEAKKKGLAVIPAALVVKTEGERKQEVWFTFPWETESDEPGGRKQATITLLRSIGEDPLREGLRDTPRRVAKMWDELTCGYTQDPKTLLDTSFSSELYDEMVVLKDIKFYSTCEHHMLPFYGKVHFAYLPDKKVVGVSKIARLVECFSRRLQIQERMTVQIGKAFEAAVAPLGVGVLVEGVHLCMMIRGVEKENAKMVTNYLSGSFRDRPEARAEFLKIVEAT